MLVEMKLNLLQTQCLQHQCSWIFLIKGANMLFSKISFGTILMIFVGVLVSPVQVVANEAPTVSNIAKAATENTTIVFQAADFTAKFSDPDGDSLVKIKVTSLPTHGTLKLADTAVEINQEIITADLDNLTFEPEENWLGNTSFSWQGNDGTVYSTNTADVNIAIVEALAPVIVGSLDTDGNAFGVAVAGDYAYVADSSKGLKIINIADPSSPNLAGSLYTDGYAWEVAVAGDYAYVADGSKGLKIINIADPSSPNLAGSLDTDGKALGVAVAGDYAYVADYDKGLKIINIADPSSPNLVGSLDTDGYAWGVAVAGDYAYVADNDEGLQIINIASAEAPVLVGSVSTYGDAWGVAVMGDYVYLADGDAGLKIIRNNESPSISDLAKAVTKNTTVTFSSADFTAKFSDPDGDSLVKIQITSLPSHGTLKLAADDVVVDQEIATADLDDLTFVPEENWVGNTSFAWQGYDGYVYSTTTAGVNIAVNKTLAPILLGSLSTDGHAYVVTVRGDYAYVADGDTGLSIINIADPTAPELVGSLTTDSGAYGIAVAGDYAYVADGDAGLKVINITDPSAPNLAGSLDTDGMAFGVAVAGDYAYVADYDKGLQIINIANPSAPELSGSLDTDGYAEGVAVAGDYAYVADGSKGLKIINIATPSTPELVSSLDITGEARGVAVVGDYAYVADYDKGLTVVNVANPATPELVGSLDTDGRSYGVAVAEDYAYVGDGGKGLKIINIATPEEPVLVGSLMTDGDARGVAVVDRYVYMAESSKGLKVVRSDEAAPVVSEVAKSELPNATMVFQSSDFKNKFTDPDGDSLTKVQAASTPNNGTLKLAGSAVTINQEIPVDNLGDLTFDPLADWHGETSFTWKGYDGFEYSTDAAKVNLLIDTPPVVSEIKKSAKEARTITYFSRDFTKAFTDVDGDSLTQVKITGLPNTGTLEFGETAVAVNDTIVVEQLGDLAFEPQANWRGETSFTWKGYDGFEYSTDAAKATVTIANIVPVIDDITKLGMANKNITFSKSDFTNEFSDGNGDSLAKIKVTSLPNTGGKLQLSAEIVEEDQEIEADKLEDIVFVPDPGWYGQTSFNWRGSDGISYSEKAGVYLDVESPGFCVKYWWVCYLIPGCLTVAGITTSISLGIFNVYKRSKPSIPLANAVELENIV